MLTISINFPHFEILESFINIKLSHFFIFSIATGQKASFVFGGAAPATSSSVPFSFAPKTDGSKPVFSISSNKDQSKPKESQSAGLLAKLLTSDEPVVTDKQQTDGASKPAGNLGLNSSALE